jgi:tetratricopeptide (TPR) repeat protein
MALHRQGRLDEAERLYRAILKLSPEHFGALHYLGMIATAQGSPEEAERLIRQALTLRDDAAARSNLGTVLAALGRHAEAIEAYERALCLMPGDADVHVNLGASLHALGRNQEAITHFETALASNPQSTEARNNLGNALMALGRTQEAVAHYQEALAGRPDFAEAQYNLGRAMMALHRTDEAIAYYRKAIALRADYFEAHENIAQALVVADRSADAVGHFETILSLKPDNAEAHNNLGQVLAQLRRTEGAVEHFRAAIALNPDFVEARVNLGSSLNFLERSTEAMDQFDTALAIDPACAGAYHGIGVVKQTFGLQEEARQAFDRAVELAPDVPEYYQGLADIKRFTRNDPHLPALERLAMDASRFGKEQRIALDFALGKAYGDIGEYERSFSHLLKANALKRATVDYDEAATLDMFPHIKKVFDADLLGRTRCLGDPSTIPILVVGMPRSGTTLVEQILASHPNVHGAGELPWMNETARKLRGADVNGYFPEAAKSWSAAQLHDLGGQYVQYLRTKAPDAKHVTDKMPMNFRFVGMIHMLLPNARIVHTRRDAADTCLSCFTKNFSGAIDYTYDLAELGRYWCAYDNLMSHWREVLPPGAMLEVQYEELVADFDSQARRLVAYCGLEWDDRCLAFHRTQRPVRTASVNQVRQPIYANSIGRWLPYKDLLGPLLHELGLSQSQRG